MSMGSADERIQGYLDRLSRAEKKLWDGVNSGICGKMTDEIEEIQRIRHHTSWKAYLGIRTVACAIRGKRLLKLLGGVIRRDTTLIRTTALAEDWLRPIKDTLGNSERALIANSDDFQELIQEQQDAILSLIDAVYSAGRKVFLIMAPYFTEERLADGYFQRVRAVDHMLAPDDVKIYASWLDADEVRGIPHVHIWDQTHIEIRYPHPDLENDKRILQIARRAGTVYHHSITFANEWVTKDENIRKIFDMHGAYPEELRMYGREEQAILDEEQERLAMRHGQCLVCVTQSMIEHLAQKYGRIPEKVILLPIFDEQRLRQCAQIKKESSQGKNIVYAGGMQKWQNVEMMQEAVYQTQGQFVYHFYTPEPRIFWKKWKYKRKPKGLEVSSKTPDEVISAYAFCDYGFLLRDDTVVNHVACPTKLVEYLAAGIIPILNTTQIGDFVKDGMAYVSLSDFVSGKLPEKKERTIFIKQNLGVVQALEERYRQGRKQLCAWMESGEN